ncbi:winged helix-turn-helix transcriptional regulator [Prauserella marina]|uniref:winged helix-turn-helix transcriptional regulator n=1 Tax=Prauserella marina TaxID=530584 RepID=UPI001B86DC25|nr:helix-turn-helix domain-containing protein [Prauserella marina]
MARKKSYDDACAIAHGLDLVGDRWALLVARELVLGPKRFTDLLSTLPGISTDMLAQRLRELTASGITERRRLPAPASSWVYELTEWGAELEPVMTQLARWSSRSSSLPRDAPISVDALILSMRALFETKTEDDFRATVAIRVGEDHFWVKIEGDRLDLGRGDAGEAEISISSDVHSLRRLIHTAEPLDRLVADGGLQVTGDLARLDRWRRRLLPAETG